MIQQFHFSVYIQKYQKKGLEEILTHLCLPQHYSQEPRGGSNPYVQQGNGYTVEYHSALKSKAILSHATTWMNPEDIMPSEINQSQKKQNGSIYMTTKVVKFIETK